MGCFWGGSVFVGFCFGFVWFIEVRCLGDSDKIYVKCVLTGEPARVIRELRDRGLARSVREAITQGLLCYMELVNERDLKWVQARAGRNLDEL